MPGNNGKSKRSKKYHQKGLKRHKNEKGLSIKSICYLPGERARPDYISSTFSRLIGGDYPFLSEELRFALILTFRGLGLSGFSSPEIYLGECLINRIDDEGYTLTGGNKKYININYREKIEERENKLRDFLTRENKKFRNQYIEIIKNCSTPKEIGIKIQEVLTNFKKEFIDRLKKEHKGMFGTEYTANTNRPKVPLTINEAAWIGYSNLRKIISDEELQLVAFDPNGNPRKPDPIHHPEDPITIIFCKKTEVLKKIEATFTQPMGNQEDPNTISNNNAAFSEELSKHHKDLIFLNLHRREGNIAQSKTPQDILEEMLKECGITTKFPRYPEYAGQQEEEQGDVLEAILKEYGITTSPTRNASYSRFQFELYVAPDGSQKVGVGAILDDGQLYQPPTDINSVRTMTEEPLVSMNGIETFISPTVIATTASSSSLTNDLRNSLLPPAKRRRLSTAVIETEELGDLDYADARPAIVETDFSDDTNSIMTVMKELTRALKEVNLEEGNIDQRVSINTENTYTEKYKDALFERLSKEPPEKRMEIETIRKAIFGAGDDVGKWAEITDPSIFSEIIAYILIDVCFEEFEKIDKDNFLPIDLNGITFLLYSQNADFLEDIKDMNADYIAEHVEDDKVYDAFVDMLVNFVLQNDDLDGKNKLLLLNPLSENEDKKIIDFKVFAKDRGSIEEIVEKGSHDIREERKRVEKSLRESILEKIALVLKEFETPASGNKQQAEFSDWEKRTENKNSNAVRCQVNGMEPLKDCAYNSTTDEESDWSDEEQSDEESEVSAADILPIRDLQPQAVSLEGNTVPSSPNGESINYLGTELVNAGIFRSPKRLEQSTEHTSDLTQVMNIQPEQSTIDLYRQIYNTDVSGTPVFIGSDAYGQSTVAAEVHQPINTEATSQSTVDLYRQIQIYNTDISSDPVSIGLDTYVQSTRADEVHQATNTDTATQSTVDLYRQIQIYNTDISSDPVSIGLDTYVQSTVAAEVHQPINTEATSQSTVDLYRQIQIYNTDISSDPVSTGLDTYVQSTGVDEVHQATNTDTATQSTVDLYRQIQIYNTDISGAPVSIGPNTYVQSTGVDEVHQPTNTEATSQSTAAFFGGFQKNPPVSIALTAEPTYTSTFSLGQQSTYSPLRTPEPLVNTPPAFWKTDKVTQREDSIDLDEQVIPVLNQT